MSDNQSENIILNKQIANNSRRSIVKGISTQGQTHNKRSKCKNSKLTQNMGAYLPGEG